MKILFYVVLAAGLLLVGSNIHDEVRGKTTYHGPGRPSMPQHASKADPETNFRGAMTYQWVKAAGLLFIGFFGLGLLRHYNRLDPFSPDHPYKDDERKAS